MTKVNDGPDFLYHVGARTAIGIRRCDPEFEQERFEQYRVGLHHICLRAKSRDDIDRTRKLVSSLGATIIRGPEERDWAPAITMCCLRTLMAFAWKSIMCQALAC